MKEYDVVIIGAGVVGCAIARELSRYQLDVAVLEKEAEPAFGVSKSNSGIIHPGTQNPPDSLKGKLCVQGNKLVRELAKELGVHFVEVGELIVAFDQKDIASLEVIKQEAEQLGVEKLEIVDSKWLKENEPNLSHEVVAALYAPTAGIISPYRFTYDLAENAMLNNVEIFCNTEVVDVDPFLNITTIKGDFSARFVINAAGLYADEISAMVGLDYLKLLLVKVKNIY